MSYEGIDIKSKQYKSYDAIWVIWRNTSQWSFFPEVGAGLPVDGPEDAVEQLLAVVRVEVGEGAAEDEPVREAHGVHQLGHLPEPDSLKIGHVKFKLVQ